MESYGDNGFLAQLGLSLLTNHKARGIKSIDVPTSNGMGDNDAIPSPEPVLGARYPLAPEAFLSAISSSNRGNDTCDRSI
jgi:hypothetical protein